MVFAVNLPPKIANLLFVSHRNYFRKWPFGKVEGIDGLVLAMKSQKLGSDGYEDIFKTRKFAKEMLDLYKKGKMTKEEYKNITVYFGSDDLSDLCEYETQEFRNASDDILDIWNRKKGA